MVDDIDTAPGRREQTKAQNRKAILDAARRVFAQMGYDAVSVRDIIRGTELASGTFYNYFKSKEEVVDALQDDAARRFRPILKAAKDEAESFEDFVRRAFLGYFRFVAEDHEATPLSEAPIRLDTPEMRAVFEEVRSHFAEAMQQGAAPMVDADYLAAASIGLAREVGLRMLYRAPIDPEAAGQFCATMVLSGLPALARSSP